MCVCECILGAVCHFFMTPNRLDCRNFLLFIFPPPKLDWFVFSTFFSSYNFHLLCVCVTRWVCRKNCGKEHFKRYTNTHTRLENDTAAGKYVFPTRIKPKLIPPGKGTPTGVLRGSRRRWLWRKSALQIVFFVLMFWQVSLLWTILALEIRFVPMGTLDFKFSVLHKSNFGFNWKTAVVVIGPYRLGKVCFRTSNITSTFRLFFWTDSILTAS